MTSHHKVRAIVTNAEKNVISIYIQASKGKTIFSRPLYSWLGGIAKKTSLENIGLVIAIAVSLKGFRTLKTLNAVPSKFI